MATAAKKAREALFVWDDADVERLLRCVLSFKVKKEGEGVDWESVKSKYECIREEFTGELEKARRPYAQFSKDRVTAKVKALRQKYRAAVDSGRRSGGGRVVATYFDLCGNIWSGSPAVESLEGGIDTSEGATLEEDDPSSKAVEDAPEPSGSKNAFSARKERRLQKKVPAEQASLALQRETLDLIKKMEEGHRREVETLTESANALTSILGNAVKLFEKALERPQQLPTFCPAPSPWVHQLPPQQVWPTGAGQQQCSAWNTRDIQGQNLSGPTSPQTSVTSLSQCSTHSHQSAEASDAPSPSVDQPTYEKL